MVACMFLLSPDCMHAFCWWLHVCPCIVLSPCVLSMVACMFLLSPDCMFFFVDDHRISVNLWLAVVALQRLQYQGYHAQCLSSQCSFFLLCVSACL